MENLSIFALGIATGAVLMYAVHSGVNHGIAYDSVQQTQVATSTSSGNSNTRIAGDSNLKRKEIENLLAEN